MKFIALRIHKSSSEIFIVFLCYVLFKESSLSLFIRLHWCSTLRKVFHGLIIAKKMRVQSDLKIFDMEKLLYILQKTNKNNKSMLFVKLSCPCAFF